MRKNIIGLLLLLIACNSFGQLKMSETDFSNLIKIGELYYGGGKLMTQDKESKTFFKELDKLKTSELENVINTFAALRGGKNEILDDRYLKRPSNKDLVYWYVIREIHYNMQDSNSIDNKIVADSVLKSNID